MVHVFCFLSVLNKCIISVQLTVVLFMISLFDISVFV